MQIPQMTLTLIQCKHDSATTDILRRMMAKGRKVIAWNSEKQYIKHYVVVV